MEEPGKRGCVVTLCCAPGRLCLLDGKAGAEVMNIPAFLQDDNREREPHKSVGFPLSGMYFGYVPNNSISRKM